MKKKEIPQAILEACKDILEYDGGCVEYIGKHEGKEAYYAYIENALTGFPHVYLWDGKQVYITSKHEGLTIASECIED